MTTKPISENEEWTIGETYEMVFDISTTFIGSIVSIFNDDARQVQIDNLLRKISEDSRLSLVGYVATKDTLTVTVKAIRAASPVMIVVWAIVGIAVLYGINLTVREVRKLVKEIGDAVGPGGLNTTLLLASASVALYFFAVK